MVDNMRTPTQEILFQMLVDVADALKHEGVEFTLWAGTALGSVRHEGFVPWDDDADLAVQSEDLGTALEACRAHLDPSLYTVLDPGQLPENPYEFAKIKAKGTIFEEPQFIGTGASPGVYIDMFPLVPLSSSRVGRVIQAVASGVAVAVSLSYTHYESDQAWKRASARVMRFLPRRMIRRIALSITNRSVSEPVFIGDLFAPGTLSRNCYPMESIVPTSTGLFESVRMPTPAAVTEYLTIKYGDFMQIPDEATQNRNRHGHLVSDGNWLERHKRHQHSHSSPEQISAD